MSAPTSIAFLLVKFQGSSVEPMTKLAAEQMFTAVGRGSMNVVDWFDDNTHGSVDIGGSAVFGWLDLSESLASYQAKRTAGTYGRTMIIDLGRAAAAGAGIDLSAFTVVVVVTNVEVDLFGGIGYACCTAQTAGKAVWEMQAAPSVLCQELIHSLGVYNHARREGSDVDYQDVYDVMSMFNALPGHHPNFPGLPAGPGLNAAFLQRCGWLDAQRASPLGTVDLRPLHRRDLPGPLYALVDGYFVEYRPSRRWDTGFPSIVLVHRIANDTSYLVAELHAGGTFAWGDPHSRFREHGSLVVDAIDDAAEAATITISYVPRSEKLAGPVLSVFATEFSDGGGLVLLGGKIFKIPPHSPHLLLARAAAALASIDESDLGLVPDTLARADVLSKVFAEIGEALEEVTGPSSPFDHLSAEDMKRFHERGAFGTSGTSAT
jgi:hypothetical protein